MESPLRNWLKRALVLDLPYDVRPPAKSGRPSAVLALFGEDLQQRPCLLVTRRSKTLTEHQGQMAFPGGMSEDSDESPTDTALRETREEIGLDALSVEPLGLLPEIWTLTGYSIMPVVGVLNSTIDKVTFELNREEIDDASWYSIEQLQDPRVYRKEFRRFGAVNFPIHVFEVSEPPIWGATGAMIRNLLDRLQSAKG